MGPASKAISTAPATPRMAIGAKHMRTRRDRRRMQALPADSTTATGVARVSGGLDQGT